ncbi:MAG TPA: efflux RND transporter periplasmic adaptor subunit [Gemmataceae bacterium]|nr:efflux RND transporter periplasmic adaptor subunit [Gemmataceae bacterium]
MNDLQQRLGVEKTSHGSRVLRWVCRTVPTVMALVFVTGLGLLGQQTGWALPKFSALLGRQQAEKDDWCVEHNVPDSQCVACRKECLPCGPGSGWCSIHGVHDCPLCYPELAQLPHSAVVSRDDLERAARGLALAPRVQNNSRCKLHQQRIQLTSVESVARLGIEVVPVGRGAVTESVVANGEIVYDPTRVAHLAARAAGTVWRVEKQQGDRVRRGEVLAIVDCAAVGRAKAEYLQTLTQRKLKAQIMARLKELAGDGVAMQSLRDAEADWDEARVRLLNAEQALLNLGLPIATSDLADLPTEEAARRLQFLGLPDDLARSLDPRTTSSNLLAVTSPLDGEVVERWVVAEERADPSKVLFVVADTRKMWLLLNVRPEDADLLKPDQPVRFRHDGHASWDEGTVSWVSLSADEKSRTVPVRVAFSNPDGHHHAHTFGQAEVVLREEPRAIVVPNEAIHWEGDCNVVFVRDKRFDEPGVPKVFHVRSVRPGVKNGPNTEILAGVLPGELVATKGSGTLRSQLLKNNLGAG